MQVPKKVANGKSIGLVGSSQSVGHWNPERGLRLSRTQDDTWYGEVDLPAG